MRHTSKLAGTGRALGALVLAAAALATASAQEAGGDKVAALKQSLQTGLAAAKKYQWVETVTVSLKGEEKSSSMNHCYYGADGQLQKVPIEGGESGGKRPHGLRGKIADHKKEDMTEYMTSAVDLIKQYVPPDPARIQASKDAGNLSVKMTAPDRHQLQFGSYLKQGDMLAVDINPTTNQVLGLHVDSYLDGPDDGVGLDVTMTTLPDGAIYASDISLDGEAKKINVDIKNTGYELHK